MDDADQLTAPSSTLALFGSILRNAENEASGDESGQGRAKLFHIATKLSKLNLLDDNASSVDSNGGVWEVIVQFLARYPDYALYRPLPDRKDKDTIVGGDGANIKDDHHGEQEEMVVWLLPRMLRRLAILGLSSSSSFSFATKSNKLRTLIEDWITRTLLSLSVEYYHKEENGVPKQREIFKELLAILQAHTEFDTPSYPVKLWMFQKGSRTSTTADPFSDQEKRDHRPFLLLLHTSIEAQSLRFSILRILVSCVCNSSTWTIQAVPEIVEAIIGVDVDWRLPTDKKATAKTCEVSIIGLLEQLDLAKRLFRAKNRSSAPRGTFSRLFTRVLRLFESLIRSYVSNNFESGTHRVIDLALFEILEDVLLHTWESEDTAITHLLRTTISDYGPAITKVLTSQINVRIGIEADTDALNPVQGCCLLILACKVSDIRRAPAQSTHLSLNCKLGTACEMLYKDDREALRRWTVKITNINLAVAGIILPSKGLLAAKTTLISSFSQDKGKKRKLDQVLGDESMPEADIDNEEASTGIFRAVDWSEMDSKGSPGGVDNVWRQDSWQAHLSDRIISHSSAVDLHTINKVICSMSMPNSDGSINASSYECSTCGPSHESSMASANRYIDALHLRNTKPNVIFEALGQASKHRAAMYSTVAALINHSEAHFGSVNFGSRVGREALSQLEMGNRSTRLAVGEFCNAAVRAHIELDAGISPYGVLSDYFSKLEHILSHAPPYIKATTVTTVIQLARITENQVLTRTLALILVALNQKGQLKALLKTQLDELISNRATTSYKLFSPHFDALCPVLAGLLDTSFGLLYAFTDIICLPVQAFLRSQGIARFFLATAVERRRDDIIYFLSEMTETSIAELLILNADCIFAPLYYRQDTKFDECQRFVLQILKNNGVDYTLQQLLESNLPALILEVFIRAESSITGKADLGIIISRIFKDIDPKTDPLTQLARPMLAIFGRAGDLLRSMYGKKSTPERVRVIQGLEHLIDKIGPQICQAIPQIMSTLQTCFKDKALRLRALLLWQKLICTLIFDDVKPLLAQSTSVFVQTWPVLSIAEKTIVHDILDYILATNEDKLGSSIYNIANLADIPEFEKFQDMLLASLAKQSFEGRLKGFLDRLDTVNESVAVQSLRELAVFLREQSTNLYKLAAGTSFAPVLGNLVHGLLTAAIRTAESRTPARSLSLQCLGILGALDPDRIVFPADDKAFVLQHDLREQAECIGFALYIIENVLTKVLRSTNDPQQQSALFLGIQGLALVCGFDDKLRKAGLFQQGVDAYIRERWNRLAKPVQEIVEPLLVTIIQVEQYPQEKCEYPLYTRKASYREWLQSWTSDLICHLIQVTNEPKNKYSCEAMFGPLRATVRRGHDLTVAYFILPYLVFYTITSGHASLIARIRTEIETVLQDQIEPGPSLMTSDSRSLCAQAVFELMDHLNTWIRARQVYLQKKYRKMSKKDEMELMMQPVRKVEAMFRELPQDAVADAALNSRSYARALLNYEKILFERKPRNDPSLLQPYYEHLHRIYAELNESDGMEGVSTAIVSPSIQHQIREHEMTGKWTAAQSCWEVQLQLRPEDPNFHLGLLRCLKNLGHYDSLRTHIAGLRSKHGDWQDVLAPYEIESAIIAGDMQGLEVALGRPSSACPESAFGRVILALRGGRQEEVDTAFTQAAELLGSTITTASKDSYHRFYDSIVNLHILHEIETFAKRFNKGASAQNRTSRDATLVMPPRLDLAAPTFHTRESILNMRRNVLRIVTGHNDPNLGALWLSTSKIAIKSGHLQTAYSAILQAGRLKTELTFVQTAKLYKAQDQLYRALQEIDQGLNEFGLLETASATVSEYDVDVSQKLAKAILQSARWMQETSRFEQSDVMDRYARAIRLSPSWEAAYYRLGQYADDLLQMAGAFTHGVTSDSKEWKQNEYILKQMETTVHNFSKALRFGTKFIYQALPRLVTIWLDLGASETLLVYQRYLVQQQNTSTAKSRRTSLSDEPQDGKIVHIWFERIVAHIRRAVERLPGYMWLSVLPQLTSRLNNEDRRVHALHYAIIEKVVKEYPQQAIWTMVGQLNSVIPLRQSTCQTIITKIQQKAKTTNATKQTDLSRIIQTLQHLVKGFLGIANYPTSTYEPLSIKTHFPQLKAIVPCDIIMPFQDSITVSLPASAKEIFAHKPFPPDLVTFSSFADEIEIMSSVAKPRKLIITGSDGQTYRWLCKPMDDLRKDNRLMECTSLVNRLLKKDAESRKRNLHIRTYAVVPLSETCGLIEWVPETAAIRGLWIKLYEPKGVQPWNENLKRIYDGIKQQQKTDLGKCGQVFANQILPLYQPVFHEWFLDSFPEPTAWLKARTAYGRTAAVMSMVGFVLGLGDRHGENILIDTTNGDCVHVDFNCLFGMGFVYFDIVEKVPFRLTQNVIDGFGITGIEGVYRRCCEVTLRILRENKNSLISVLESFVHDPLLDLQLARPGHRKAIGSSRTDTKETKAKREEEGRKAEARAALATISNKLKGSQATTKGDPKEGITTVDMTVENLFKEATDPKNLGGMYMGWAAWM